MIGAVAPGDPSTLFNWAQFGVTGMVIVGALFGWIWFKPAVEELKSALEATRSDLKEAREDLKRQGDIMREILVPAVAKSSELLQRVADEIWRARGAA